MNFNKQEFDLFRKEIKKAVKSVEDKFDVEIKFSSITYNENDFTIKTTVFNGSAEESLKAKFESLCELYGLQKDDFGKTITNKNTTYKISGIDTKRRKYPIMATDENGEVTLFTVEGVKRMLGRK